MNQSLSKTIGSVAFGADSPNSSPARAWRSWFRYKPNLWCIRTALQQMLADPALTLKFETKRVEVGPSADMASTVGNFVVTMTDPVTKSPVTSTGTYVTVYRKQGGEWKAVFDIASSGTDTAGGKKQ
jgi:Domain of unknown function (DUF4440)